MTHNPTDTPARRFAVQVVEKLRHAGFQSLWAGGCVRDQLLGLSPKDYDVATDATPDEVQELFGRRHTHAVGAAFGVVTVRGPRDAGHVEVATFREDAGYSDGRRPDSVRFSSPEQDALRRDFTINGLFYDPLQDRVIDYVGGQQDMADGIVRAIGDPAARISEDKLRMMRGVRFATRFGFELDRHTADEILANATSIHLVSAERITNEFQLMMEHSSRVAALELLHDLQLLEAILPPASLFAREPNRFELMVEAQRNFEVPPFVLSWCTLLWPLDQSLEEVESLSRSWRLSNDDRKQACWIIENADLLREADKVPWPKLQRVLVHPTAPLGIAFVRATQIARQLSHRGVDFAADRLRWPREQLNPNPLIDGQDLIALGLQPGKEFRVMLEEVRDRQLTGELNDRAAALDWLQQRLKPPAS